MTGTLLNNQLVRLVIEQSIQETAGLFVVNGQMPEQAEARVVPIRTQRSVYGNSWLNYRSFLLAALQTHVWHVVVVLVTLVAVGREFRDGTLGPWWALSGGRLGRALLGKLALPSLTLLGWAAAIHLLALRELALPVGETLGLWLGAALATQLFYQSAALLALALLHNLRLALSAAAVYTLPAFAFIGVTFPVANMDAPARLWQSLLPVGALLRVQNGLLHNGWSGADVLAQCQPLALAAVLLALPALVLLRSKIHRPDVEGRL